MHSTDIHYTGPSRNELFTAHHDGDIAGPGSEISLRLPAGRADLEQDGGCTIRIPFDVIAWLVADAVRARKISDLEGMETRKVLGL